MTLKPDCIIFLNYQLTVCKLVHKKFTVVIYKFFFTLYVFIRTQDKIAVTGNWGVLM